MHQVQQTRRRRRNLTLIEIIVVITLIGLIMGALAYNYQGSLEKGRAFMTEQRMRTIEEVLILRVAEDPDIVSDIRGNWKELLKGSPLVKNADELAKDGWGREFQVYAEENMQTGEIEIKVESDRLARYKEAQGGR